MFTLSFIKHTRYVTITADESARDHVIARLFVYVYGEDKVIWSQTKV